MDNLVPLIPARSSSEDVRCSGHDRGGHDAGSSSCPQARPGPKPTGDQRRGAGGITGWMCKMDLPYSCIVVKNGGTCPPNSGASEEVVRCSAGRGPLVTLCGALAAPLGLLGRARLTTTKGESGEVPRPPEGENLSFLCFWQRSLLRFWQRICGVCATLLLRL